MDKNGILYIVATPIGNLEDITLRALRILKEVDLIACEDTRVTRKLLNHYSIATHSIAFHQHTDSEKTQKIIEDLKGGKNIALVTDAGTPGVSDPGNKLVEAAIAAEIIVLPIPGASAIASIVSVAGIDMQQFTFLGFPPHKKGRETYFKKVAASKIPVMYYESPHRVLKNLELLAELSKTEFDSESEKNSGKAKKIILGRELTKMFEEVVRGSIEEVLKYFQEIPSKVKGEFVIIVH
ncbi:MAG: hypothetical protein ACD_9C00324G0001 [uncultured bacterium]|nr:MAG: hypothetical protein ACD_9C00324G0001 [uncultured bacterium]KKQ44209.1 MAG: Ribosomal RNA small subunit methyltransferase I [Candidatus Moranbacteria bacterium GW2011_GWC2_37_8]KKQ61609.1 MAG: Ribosomal RNA small subunit methyltransferase I [Parcubacteria group bacterium GW2011_GWC1_38_22]